MSNTLLTVEEEYALASVIRNPSKHSAEEVEKAKRTLFERNMGLVYTLASKYFVPDLYKVSLQDMVSEGMVGLWKAVERYDASFKRKFSVYASYHIKQRIFKEVERSRSTVRSSSYSLAKGMTILRLLDTMTKEEVSSELGLSIKAIDRMLESVTHDVVVEEGWEESIHDMSSPLADLNVEFSDEIERILESFSVLDARERKILRMRYGMKPYSSPHTLEQIGAKLSITRERVRQIEERSLRKIRRRLSREEKLASLNLS